MLDDFLDFDEWKRTDEDPFYDWRLIGKVRKLCCPIIGIIQIRSPIGQAIAAGVAI